MRKFLTLAAVGTLLAAPVFAQTMVIEFAAESGEGVTVSLADDGTYTATDGTAGTYTWDEATQTLCGKSDAGEVCATFEGEATEPAVGVSRAFSDTAGLTGTATIIAIEE
ncbi:MAG: hypothetical protein MRY64_13585 [Hyphomonadaceae bacterium]|nr:hypothetical protein [Hyphomonadaceae bacterium]